jgi:hypothetical protein
LGVSGEKPPLQASEIDKLVHTFESLKEFESILLDVRAGLRNILCLKRFDEDSFKLQDAKRTFYVVTNEKFVVREKTFAGYNVFPAGKAEQEFARLNEGKPAEMQERKYELLPPQEFFQKYYEPFIVPIFALFHRDRLSAECICGVLSIRIF